MWCQVNRLSLTSVPTVSHPFWLRPNLNRYSSDVSQKSPDIKDFKGEVSTAPYSEDPATQRIRNRKYRRNWIDSLRVTCNAGAGGNGLPKYGGVGGKGGDCLIEAVEGKDTPNLTALFKKTFKGKSTNQNMKGKRGQDARKYCIIGPMGEDATLEVPIGVTVNDDNGKLLHDLDLPGMKVKVASGGQGGGPTNNWLGLRGETKYIRLELKLMADVGLVGFPNAGKSTLLKAISRAKPKIAGYPFTTIKPNLGHLQYEDQRVITMADLPGLIEGAHYNVGMGHAFLKHVERTKMLLFVIDVHGFKLGINSQFRSAFETVVLLNRELELYNPDLIGKPCLCLLNKMDAEGADTKLKEFEDQYLRNYDESLVNLDEDLKPRKKIQFDEMIPISAKCSKKTVNYVKDKLRHWLDAHDEKVRIGDDSLRSEIVHLLSEKSPQVI